MDVAALNLSIKSDDVVVATAALDKFSASADRAGAAGAKLSGGGGNTAKLATDYARAARAADQAGGAVAKASQMVAAANAHVVTYRNHLQGIVTASGQAAAAQVTLATAVSRTSMATQQADAHVIAHRANLERLAAAQKAAGTASSTAATQVASVGVAGRATGAILSGLAGILGGLVGVIIGSVVAALIEMLASLWDNDEAMKAVTVASDNLGTAQSVLGQMFDLSTGKIKSNTAAIRDNIYMQAVAFEATAAQAKVDAAKELSEGGLSGPGRGARFLRQLTHPFENRAETERALASSQDGRNAENIRKIGEGLAAGNISRIDAGRALEAALANGQISQKQYIAAQNSFNRSIEQQTATTGARDLRAVLDGAELPSRYRKADTGGGSYRRAGSRGSGGKSDAEKLADLVRNAQAEITIEQNRSKAVELSAEAAAELEQRTKLLNAASSAGLKTNEALTKQIEKLAAAYAEAKVAADVAEVTKATTSEIQKRIDAIGDESKLIGLRGDALARETRELEAQKKFRDALPKEAIVVQTNLTGKESDAIDSDNRARRIADLKNASEDAAYAMELERAGLHLTGKAALEYAFVSERLNEAQRTRVNQSPEEIANIRDAGKAYAEQRYAIDQQARAFADAREVAGGFFSDWINGVREGGNLFKTFADSVINGLNRIIDKLMGRAFESLFSGSGFLGSILGAVAGGGLSAANSSGGPKTTFKNANGNAFDSGVMRFAKGAAFTNQIVTSPTPFRFAKGAALGEMGEEGPEAIMPLSRGPDGKLGVHARGGGGRSTPPNVNVSIQQDFHLTGTVSQKDVEAMSRQAAQQGAEVAVNTVRRNFDSYLNEWNVGGAVVA